MHRAQAARSWGLIVDKIIEIEVVNWEKYNPRSDRGGFSWFRMDNQFFLHMRQRKGYSADATVLMAFLLAESSANNGKSFKLRIGFAAEMLGRADAKIEIAVEDLLKQGDVRFKPLEAAPSLTERTDGRTEQNETDNGQPAVVVEFDFELAFQVYPRRIKVSEGIRRAKKVILSPEEFDQFRIAIQRYRNYCEAQGTAEKYIMHPTTFVEKRDEKPYIQPWREWVQYAPQDSGQSNRGIEDILKDQERSA